MDRRVKTQICIIIVGLFLMALGIYFYSLRIDFTLTSLVTLSGVVLLSSGLKYKKRMNRKPLTGDERAAYLNSGYFIITAIGAVVLFSGLAGGAVFANYLHAGTTALWFLLVAFVGMLLIFAARSIKPKTEKIPA